VACASYAAKALGIQRGVALHEAKQMCPSLVVLPSDYETYSLSPAGCSTSCAASPPGGGVFRGRGLCRPDRDAAGAPGILRTIALRIQEEISRELGLTVSVGLSTTKVLAKVASKRRKPNGFTAIPGRSIPSALEGLPVEKVWGIGPATTNYLAKMGVRTALEFIRLPRRRSASGHQARRRDLAGAPGGFGLSVLTEEKSVYASISKTRTFARHRRSEYLFAHLLRNLESACIKAGATPSPPGGSLSS